MPQFMGCKQKIELMSSITPMTDTDDWNHGSHTAVATIAMHRLSETLPASKVSIQTKTCPASAGTRFT